MPDIGTISGVVGGIVGAGGLIVGLLRIFSDGSDKASERKQQLDKQIDARVEQQLTSAWGRIDTLEATVKDLSGVADDNVRIKAAVRKFFDMLISWDRGGRRGPIPAPSQDDANLLDVAVDGDTFTRARNADHGPTPAT